MLKELLIITLSVTNTATVEEAYSEYFGYETVETGEVSDALADLWQTPQMSGRKYLIMKPSAMTPVYLRFVENDPVEAFSWTSTQGWNAFELVVNSPDALVPHLAGSPFKLLGQPKDLYPVEGAPRVMQVTGPAGEVVYLTRPSGGVSTAKPEPTFVGRSFIVVTGGTDIEAARKYWNKSFNTPVAPAQNYKITTISKLNDLPLDTEYPLAIVPTQGKSIIELDGYPKGWPKRTAAEGMLPPGMAAVGFLLNSFNSFNGKWQSEPRAIEEFPYNGRQVGLTVGANGEWIELVAE